MFVLVQERQAAASPKCPSRREKMQRKNAKVVSIPTPDQPPLQECSLIYLLLPFLPFADWPILANQHPSLHIPYLVPLFLDSLYCTLAFFTPLSTSPFFLYSPLYFTLLSLLPSLLYTTFFSLLYFTLLSLLPSLFHSPFLLRT